MDISWIESLKGPLQPKPFLLSDQDNPIQSLENTHKTSRWLEFPILPLLAALLLPRRFYSVNPCITSWKMNKIVLPLL